MKLGPRETKMINRNERSKAKRDISKVKQDKLRESRKTKEN